MSKFIFTQLLIFAFGIGTILDFVMTSIGLALLSKTDGIFGALACYLVGFAFIVLIAGIATLWKEWRNPIYLGCLLFAGVALATSLAADITTIGTYVVAQQSPDVDPSKGLAFIQGWGKGNGFTILTGIAFLAFVFVSPIFFSSLLREQLIHLREREKDNEEE